MSPEVLQTIKRCEDLQILGGPAPDSDALVAAVLALAGARSSIEWPKEKSVSRMGDMTPPFGSILTVGLDNDADAYVSLWNDDADGTRSASIEFCNGGGGGGHSLRTRRALIALMCAIEADNAEFPHKAHPQPRAQAEAIP